MSSLTLEDIDSVSEAGGGGGGGSGGPPTMPVSSAPHLPPRPNMAAPSHMGPPPMPNRDNTLPPAPYPTSWAQTYNSNPYGPSYNPLPPPIGGQVKNYTRPAPYLNETASFVSMPGNGAESVHSGSGKGVFPLRGLFSVLCSFVLQFYTCVFTYRFVKMVAPKIDRFFFV